MELKDYPVVRITCPGIDSTLKIESDEDIEILKLVFDKVIRDCKKSLPCQPETQPAK